MPAPVDAVSLTLTLIEMLRNDMRIVVETRCKKHGKPGPAPNFTACLLPLIACETIGVLTASSSAMTSRQATLAFITRVGTMSGDSRYGIVASALFTFFRHGIAHSFLPKAYTLSDRKTTITAACAWHQNADLSTDCLDDLQSSSNGQKTLADWRKSHLAMKTHGKKTAKSVSRAFIVCPQVLFLDVDRAIGSLESQLKAGGSSEVALITGNYPVLPGSPWVNE